MIKTDVAVIGGGSAGICAAIAAARQGAKVVLLERSSKLGGMGSRALVHTFCGLYHPDTSKPPVVANEGLPREIEAEMRRRTGQAAPDKMGKVYVLRQDPEIFDALAKELAAEEEKLTTLFETNCESITQQNGFTITAGTHTIRSKALVDTSADATVAKLLGATRRRADLLQRPAFIFSLKNVSPLARDADSPMRLALDIIRGVQSGELPEEMQGVASRASTRDGEIYFTMDLDDPSKGRSLAEELIAFLRKTSPAYANAGAPTFAECPGIRETYRWLGQYTLTSDDLIRGQTFPDTVAYATWPIELRETTKGPKFQYFDKAEPSSIPLRVLTSAEIPGIYFAGRCLSATHEALASVRVMGTCFATGQAAGRAAADYAKTS